MKESMVDVQRLASIVATTDKVLKTLIVALLERQRDDSTRFE